jgi:hypothetical protein
MGHAAGGKFEEGSERSSFDHGTSDVVRLAGSTAALMTIEPGWRWSTSVKPMVGGDSCQTHHLGYVLAGRLGVRTNEGKEHEFGPGDVYEIRPGHEGWVMGDETYRAIEFRSVPEG